MGQAAEGVLPSGFAGAALSSVRGGWLRVRFVMGRAGVPDGAFAFTE
jgi:hypothetical protein